MKVIEGKLNAQGKKFAIVISRFNDFIGKSLLDGAVDTLKRIGDVNDDDITVVYVPGAVELPLAAKRIAAKKEFDAIISLGVIIRGGTPHFEFVAGECSKGLASVMMEYDIPVAFGVLTVDTIEQAIERSGTKAGNKGEEAAMSAFEMVALLKAMEA